jgi:hypothetical protein
LQLEIPSGATIPKFAISGGSDVEYRDLFEGLSQRGKRDVTLTELTPQIVKHLHNLKPSHLSLFGDVSDEAVTALLQPPVSTSLQSLTLQVAIPISIAASTLQLSSWGMCYVPKQLSALPETFGGSLRKLKLMLGSNASEALEIASFLERCPVLEDLTIDGFMANLNAKELETILRVFRGGSLARLRLTDLEIPVGTLLKLLDSAGIGSLRALDLSNNPGGIVSSGMSDVQHLHTLRLHSCELDDQAIGRILETLNPEEIQHIDRVQSPHSMKNRGKRENFSRLSV